MIRTPFAPTPAKGWVRSHVGARLSHMTEGGHRLLRPQMRLDELLAELQVRLNTVLAKLAPAERAVVFAYA